MRRAFLLVVFLLVPFLLAQDGTPEATEPAEEEPKDDIVQKKAAEKPACAHPVEILWNEEPRSGTGTMAVSVQNARNGQQLPRLPADAFSLTLNEEDGPTAQITELSQSADALAPPQGKPTAVAEALRSDPVEYDAFFAVDLSRSMDTPRKLDDGRERSHRDIAVSLIQRITGGGGTKERGVLGPRDRIFVSGFDNTVQKELMTGLTRDRAAIRPTLASILEYSPKSESTALFSAIHENLTIVERLAPSYRDMEKRREAVLFVITDSFNGRDLDAQKTVSRCAQSKPYLESIIEQIGTVQRATDQGFRLYILALGEDGSARGYSPNAAPGRSCRPSTAQKSTVDGYSFRTMTSPELGTGGTLSSSSEDALFDFVQEEFELHRQAYKLSYKLPKGAKSPSRYQLSVRQGNVTCSDSVRSSGDIVPPMAAGADLDITPPEMALFLASLLMSLLFVPRLLTNLRANLGGGDGAA